MSFFLTVFPKSVICATALIHPLHCVVDFYVKV
nr:MAG TPA: hypothetical protein [Caudoviricetes sp.]